MRFGLAAAVLIALMLALRLKPPRGPALAGAMLFGLLNFFAAFALAYYALVHLHAGFGQTLLALVPLMTLLLAAAQHQERLRLRALAGTLLALAGVAVMARAPLSASVPMLSILAAIGAALSMAQSTVLVRRLPPVHPVTMNAIGMAVGAAALVFAALIAGEPIRLPQQAATWLTLAYLVPVGSVGVFLLFLTVLRHWPASRAAYLFVLAPLITLALSAWLDAEPIGWGLVLGGTLVVGGVYLGSLRGAPAPLHARAPDIDETPDERECAQALVGDTARVAPC